LVPANVPEEFVPPIIHHPNLLETEQEEVTCAQASPFPTYFENQEDNLMLHPGEADGVPEYWALDDD
jgi:hypothetical protein